MAKKKKIRKDRIFIVGLAGVLLILGLVKGCSFLFKEGEAIFEKIEEDKYDATVILDPGHGGKDVGSQNGTLYEKDITLKVAKAIGNKLAQQNIRVIYTRESDIALDSDKQTDLKMRAQMSAKYNADYFVSIHVNDYEDSNAKVTGFEIYVKDDAGTALATSIENCWEELNYSKIRGIQDGSELAVIRQNTVPAILVELGYINGLDVSYLQDDNKLVTVGETIAKGIMDQVTQDKSTEENQ